MANFTPVGVEATIKGLGPFTRGLDKMRTDITKTGKSTESVGKQFLGLGKNVLGVGAKMAKVAAGGVALLGTAIAGVGVISVKTAISYESAFAGVIKTTDGLTDSTGELTAVGKELRQGFRDLAKEVPTTVEELAEIGEIGGQLGIGKEALIDFTRTVADLGVATNLTTEEAAFELARIANIFGIETDAMGENSQRLGSTIVALGNSFATTERDIASFAERVAGAGNIAGLTQADVLAIGTAMSSVGIQAEAGGTAVQKVLLAMNNAVVGTSEAFVDNTAAIDKNQNRLLDLNAKLVTLEAQTGLTGDALFEQFEAFKAAGGAAADFGRELGDTRRAQLFKTIRSIQDLNSETDLLRENQGKPITAKGLETFAKTAGLTAEEFKTLWQEDASKAFELFVLGLGEQGDAAIGTLEKLDLTDQRLVRSFLSLAGAGDLITETLALADEAWEENTALTEEAEKRYRTTESQIKLLKNQLRDMAITIGDAALPFINELIQAARPLIEELGKRLPSAIEAVISKTRELIGAFKAGGVGGLAGALGFSDETISLIQKIGQQIVDAIQFVQRNWEAFKGALIGIGAVLASAGIVAAIAGIAVVIGSLLSPIGLLVIAAGLLGAAWNTNVLGIRDAINLVVAWFREKLPDAISKLASAFGAKGLGGVLELVGSKFSELINVIRDRVTSAWPIIRNTLFMWAANFWNWLTGPGGVVSQAKDRIVSFVNIIADIIIQQWPTILAGLMEWTGLFWNWLTGSEGVVNQVAGRITTFVNAVARQIIGQWPTIRESLLVWTSLAWDWLTGSDGAISQVASRIISFANAIAQEVANQWSIIQTKLMEWTTLFWNWLTGEGGVITQIADKVIPVITAIGSVLAQNWPTIRDSLAEWTNLFWNWLVGEDGVITNITPHVVKVAFAIGAAIAGAWENVIRPFLFTWAARFWDWLTGEGGVLERADEKLKLALSQIGQAIAEKWPIIAAQLVTWGTKFWEWLTGPGGAIEQAGTELDKIAANFEEWVDNNEELFVSIGEKIADGILAGIIILVGSAQFGKKVSDSMSAGIFSIMDSFKQIGIDIATGIVTGLFERLTGIEIPPAVVEGIKASLTKIFEISPLAGPQGILNIFTQGFDALKTIISEFPGLVADLGEAFSELKLPLWLMPGSPTPFEIGLLGIATALTGVVSAGLQVFSDQALAVFEQVKLLVQNVDAALTLIWEATLPQLQVVTQTTADSMMISFNQVAEAISQVNSLLSQMISLLQEAASAATKTAKAMVEGFKDAADTIEDDLIDALEELRDILEDVKTEAEAAAAAVNDIGRGTPTAGAGVGPGFQAGADFIVPPGFSDDRFPMRVSSGERVIVVPREEVGADGAGGGIGNEFNLTVQTVAAPSAIIQQFEVMQALVS